MLLDDCYKIGYVAKPHGLKGEVTIAIDPDIPNDFATLDAVFLSDGGALIPFFITASSVTQNKAFVKFEDVDSLDAAESLVSQSIYLPKTARPKSEKGEFYDDEVIGFLVVDEDLGELGKIVDIMTAGPNRLLVVDYNEKEVLIPINSPFVTSINKSKKKMATRLPEGFLDI